MRVARGKTLDLKATLTAHVYRRVIDLATIGTLDNFLRHYERAAQLAIYALDCSANSFDLYHRLIRVRRIRYNALTDTINQEVEAL